MPQLEYFLVCRSIQTDINTNEISFINVLEDIVPDDFPAFLDNAIAVSVWNFQDGEPVQDNQAILVVKVPGKPVVKFNMNIAAGQHRFRAIQGILDIPIEQSGDITFEVLLNGEHAASHRVRIHPPEVKAQPEGGENMHRTS